MENKLLKNINKIMSLLNITLNGQGEYSRISLSFTVFYLTNFEYKLNIDNSCYEGLFHLTNRLLCVLNSRFLINDDMNELEYINYILYIFCEFDVINDYIDYIKKLEKKHISITLDNLIDFGQQYSNNDIIYSDNLLAAFNRLNFVFKN